MRRGFHRYGLGWKFHKQYIKLVNPLLSLITRRQLRLKRQQDTAEAQELEALVPYPTDLVEEGPEKVKLIAIRVLNVLHQLAERNGFEYHLAYGTLLGAIRHGGFIPWDDDIDIMMTNTQFQRFYQLAHQIPRSLRLYRVGKNFWKLMDRHTIITKDGKRGIAVDIFLVEELPQEYAFINVHKNAYCYLDHKVLFPTQNISFEGEHTFMAPAQPELILEKIYGDWSKLPPVEQRINSHLGSNLIFNAPTSEPIHPLA